MRDLISGMDKTIAVITTPTIATVLNPIAILNAIGKSQRLILPPRSHMMKLQ